MNSTLKIYLSVITSLLLFCSCSDKQNNNQINFKNIQFQYKEIKGIEKSANITRRDPSDIIRFSGKYYLWYTKTDKGRSGYNATIWYATSVDGLLWNEIGEALGRGNKGSWDEFSVFTPNILVAENKYYLFYTAVKRTPNRNDFYFENNSKNDFTAIGIAVSNSPDESFTRIKGNPVLTVSNYLSSFDSYRVDDACIIVRDNKYWLYYKGRSLIYGASGPANTKMGVAFANNPEGPYQKYYRNPVVSSGHEVVVWPFNEGVMTLISAVGENGKTIQFADDGLNFKILSKIDDNYPNAPGCFRADNFIDKQNIELNNFWGISMNHGNNEIWPYLIRYDFTFPKD